MATPQKKQTNMKAIGAVTLCVLLALTVAVSVLGFTGMKVSSDGLYKLLSWLPGGNPDWKEALKPGVDLNGGLYVELTPEKTEDNETTLTALTENAMKIMHERLTAFGTDGVVVERVDGGNIRVSLPNDDQATTTMNLIANPGHVTFLSPAGEAFMDNNQIVRAGITADSSGTYTLSIQLTKEGQQLFADMTEASVGQSISIAVDGTTIASPQVSERLDSEAISIPGQFTRDNAAMYALYLNYGQLPVTLSRASSGDAQATLGEGALDKLVLASAAALLLIIVYMVIFCGMPGVFSAWALWAQIVLLPFLCAIAGNVSLSMSGAAGLLLSYAVTACVTLLAASRIKSQLKKGRAFKDAARAGLKRATVFSADLSVIALILSVAFMAAGQGGVIMFARSLALGMCLNLAVTCVFLRVLTLNWGNLTEKNAAVKKGGASA